MSTINLADLTPAQLQILLGQLTDAQNAEKAAAKERRERARAWMAPRFAVMVKAFGTRVMGDSGVIGQTIGGTVNVFDPTTGKPRAARVSMSLKWIDTLPAKEKAAAEAETSDDSPEMAPDAATDAPATEAPATDAPDAV